MRLSIDLEQIKKDVSNLKVLENIYKDVAPHRAFDYFHAWKNKEAILQEWYLKSGD